MLPFFTDETRWYLGLCPPRVVSFKSHAVCLNAACVL